MLISLKVARLISIKKYILECDHKVPQRRQSDGDRMQGQVGFHDHQGTENKQLDDWVDSQNDGHFFI